MQPTLASLLTMNILLIILLQCVRQSTYFFSGAWWIEVSKWYFIVLSQIDTEMHFEYSFCYAVFLVLCRINNNHKGEEIEFLFLFLLLMELVLLLQKPIVPDVYRVIRDSQLIGMCGYSREVWYKVIIIITVSQRSFIDCFKTGKMFCLHQDLNFYFILLIFLGSSCHCCWCRAQYVWQSICKNTKLFLTALSF